ncbi:hypothetical protein MKX01_007793 [Papaver californicum]|nr:hypothetical protein MKX01_007793 [Papaver californicum]
MTVPKSTYVPKPTYVQRPEVPYVTVPKPTYVQKPEVPYVTLPKPTYAPQPTYVQKPSPSKTYGYGRKLREYVATKPGNSKPYVALPKPLPKPEPYSVKSVTYTTQGIQGFIYCKSGAKLTPLEGAVARVTCIATDPYDNRAPFSTLSPATNDKGYFLATLPLKVEGNLNLTKCKTFLYSSPSQTCNIPIVITKDDYQVPSSCKVVPGSKMNLCSVGPFAYTTPTVSKPAYHGRHY